MDTQYLKFVLLELQPYKYAGYPNLLATIQMEIQDEALYARELPLLPSSTELAYHTVHCSALNAEELRREHGLLILRDAMLKCFTAVTNDSKVEEFQVKFAKKLDVQCLIARYESCQQITSSVKRSYLNPFTVCEIEC